MASNRVLYFVTAAAFALSVYNAFLGPAVAPAVAQNDTFLSRRIDQVEQRLYSIESRLNRVESLRPTVTSPAIPSTNDIESQFVRTQIDGLRTRVGELECGVLRLDERTLSPAKKIAAKSTEPCRRDPGSVLQLSSRH